MHRPRRAHTLRPAVEPPENLQHDVSLADQCTLGLGGPALHLAHVASEPGLAHALAWAGEQRLPACVLGSGSNVVVHDDGFAGLVVRLGMRDASVTTDDTQRVRVRVGAGETWDAFVERAVAEGWAGIECLSGIPGRVGATPLQNVGAYGQEVFDTIVEVRVFDPRTMQPRVLPASACAPGYRTSAFKNPQHPLHGCIVTSVTFELRRGPPALPTYAELSRALALRSSAPPSLAVVRETVLALRADKSMLLRVGDPDARSVGSFFTNPVIDLEQAERLARRAARDGLILSPDQMPRYPSGRSQVKLPAAWLIERSGFRKGYRRGSVGISSRHALALVHHGGGRTSELVALADEIVSGVQSTFGVALRWEAVPLGFPPRPG